MRTLSIHQIRDSWLPLSLSKAQSERIQNRRWLRKTGPRMLSIISNPSDQGLSVDCWQIHLPSAVFQPQPAKASSTFVFHHLFSDCGFKSRASAINLIYKDIFSGGYQQKLWLSVDVNRAPWTLLRRFPMRYCVKWVGRSRRSWLSVDVYGRQKNWLRGLMAQWLVILRFRPDCIANFCCGRKSAQKASIGWHRVSSHIDADPADDRLFRFRWIA